MFLHSCYLSGTIHVDSRLTPNGLRKALAPALENITLPRRLEPDAFVLSRGTLAVSLSLSTAGASFTNPEIDAFMQVLNHLSTAPGHLVMEDYDEGSSDGRTRPFFIGRTDDDRKAAQVLYGIAVARTWLEPVLGKQPTSDIEAFIRAIPLPSSPDESAVDDDSVTTYAPRG
jgi:hypothetical protein